MRRPVNGKNLRLKENQRHSSFARCGIFPPVFKFQFEFLPLYPSVQIILFLRRVEPHVFLIPLDKFPF